jgi:MOSC domain-containing protein YiiM
LNEGLAGIFFRVLVQGPLCVGDSLVLTSRPHPAWNLTRVSTLLYGERVFRASARASWLGTDEELAELLSIEELGELEYRDAARAVAEQRKAARSDVPSTA